MQSGKQCTHTRKYADVGFPHKQSHITHSWLQARRVDNNKHIINLVNIQKNEASS